MKKLTSIIITLVLINSNLLGQLKVTQNGLVGVNTFIPYEAFQIGGIWTFHNGTSKTINYNAYWNGSNVTRIATDECSSMNFNNDGSIAFRLGSTGDEGSTVTMKDAFKIHNQSGAWGEGIWDIRVDLEYSSNEPTLKPSLNGGHGFLGTSEYRWSDIHVTNVHRVNEFNISDQKVKDNISDINDAMAIISQLRGVTFDFNEKAFTGLKNDKKLETLLNRGKNNYGFIAQEVKEVLPQLVNYDKIVDLHSVNYESIIPILVEAVKEQKNSLDESNSKINMLEDRIAELENIVNNNTKSGNSLNSSSDWGSSESKSILYQNNPNPFNQYTLIQFFIPDNVSESRLFIYDMNGLQIMSFNVNERGKSEIEIQASKLKPGMYMYSLVLDNELIDTKTMILTN